jgi:pantoate--beta-alanine ligase
MRIVRSIADLRVLLKTLREQGKRIGFVPTMGYLHEGHGALVKQAAARCDATVVSIFVNPTQFGQGEDLAKYPRDLERDQGLCLEWGATVLFLPEASEIYPSGFQTFVEPGRLAEPLCGQFRPGHFRGVATVVAKLFNMVEPDLAFFGQKDFQQTMVVRRMVRDLNLPVDVVVVPTIREEDGLAMSSRNAYLSEEERARALSISRGLLAAEAAFKAGERKVAHLLDLVRAHVSEPMKGVDRLQYLELVDAQTLDPHAGEVDRTVALCLAAYVGATRLIDNVVLAPSADEAVLNVTLSPQQA